MTKFISKASSLASADAERRIRELCAWIQQNSERSIGWEDLMSQSGFSHQDLILLFKLYLKTSPMAFIKSLREQKGSSAGRVQPPLF